MNKTNMLSAVMEFAMGKTEKKEVAIASFYLSQVIIGFFLSPVSPGSPCQFIQHTFTGYLLQVRHFVEEVMMPKPDVISALQKLGLLGETDMGMNSCNARW